MNRELGVHLFGDTAVLAEVDSNDQAHRLGAAIGGSAWDGVEDVVVGFRSVTVVVDPELADVVTVAAAVRELATTELQARVTDERRVARTIDIPVAFDGPDLEDVATACGTSIGDVVRQLSDATLRVAFLGFSPGFAYLTGLTPELAAVGRRSRPRSRVPAGSLAVAGGFAAIYPSASPGGWQIVGRTDIELFNQDQPPYALLQPGYTVRLRPARVSARPDATPRQRLRSASPRWAEVVSGGPLSTIQDAGRRGVADIGVPKAGAADPWARMAANQLVGNAPDAGVLEATLHGPALRLGNPAYVAVIGAADVSVDGRPAPANVVVPVDSGQTLAVGEVRAGVRAYIGVDGGFEVPAVFRSRSSDVLCGLGVGPLVAGDVVGLGMPSRPRGRWSGPDLSSQPGWSAPEILRAMPGPDQSPAGGLAHALNVDWVVASDSDRIGVRLARDMPPDAFDPLETAPGGTDWGGIESHGVVTGAVQFTPDRSAIALLCDHATVGGYPVVATVISSDLGKLARCRPGDRVRFELVDVAGAAAARRAAEKALRAGVTGWYPVRAD
jgi:KipI family sensor histidine kinase inhibitor